MKASWSSDGDYKTPYLAVGNDELGSTVKAGDTVRNHAGVGTVYNSGKNSKLVDGTFVEYKGSFTLQFVEINGAGYLAGINGQLLPGVEKI